MPPTTSAAPPRGFLRTIAGEAVRFAMVVGVVMVARTVVAEPFYVPSGSMEPTLQIGDEMLALKYAYGYGPYSLPLDLGHGMSGRILAGTPARGDVVVFHPPGMPEEVYVKRVIGLPGDRIQMVGGRLRINGAELPLRADGTGPIELSDGRRVEAPRYVETLPGGREHPIFKLGWDGPLDETPVLTVPAGDIFVMGDNRDNSLDSRVPQAAGGVGFVPMDHLVGRAAVILGSWDFLAAHGEPFWAWLSDLRVSRFLKSIG